MQEEAGTDEGDLYEYGTTHHRSHTKGMHEFHMHPSHARPWIGTKNGKRTDISAMHIHPRAGETSEMRAFVKSDEETLLRVPEHMCAVDGDGTPCNLTFNCHGLYTQIGAGSEIGLLHAPSPESVFDAYGIENAYVIPILNLAYQKVCAKVAEKGLSGKQAFDYAYEALLRCYAKESKRVAEKGLAANQTNIEAETLQQVALYLARFVSGTCCDDPSKCGAHTSEWKQLLQATKLYFPKKATIHTRFEVQHAARKQTGEDDDQQEDSSSDDDDDDIVVDGALGDDDGADNIGISELELPDSSESDTNDSEEDD